VVDTTWRDEFIKTKDMHGKVYALHRFIYTTAILVDCSYSGYGYRYCYPNHADAVEAFETWDGLGDPPGNWLKRKGRDGDYSNPDYEA
jgi:hypothetical protein